MKFIDVDSNAATFNSSQATFTVPRARQWWARSSAGRVIWARSPA